MAFLQTFTFKVSLILGEGNMVADSLSKLAIDSSSNCWEFLFPTTSLKFHAVDIKGIGVFDFLS